jgi:hypothetical protein
MNPPLRREIRTLARIQGNTNLAHPSAPPTIDQGSHTDTPPRVVVPVVRPPKPPTTGELRLPVGDSIVRRLVKPVGMAVLLCALQAWAATSTITAPQGNVGACPYPGCKQTLGRVVVTDPPYSVTPGPVADMTGKIQQAIDSGAAELYFPAGTYVMCNLMPRAQNQRWQGAGPGQTIFTGTTACNNLVTTSFGGVFGGPAFNLAITGITFQGGVQAQLAVQCRDIPARLAIHHNAFDSGGVGCPTTSAGPSGISMNGCRDAVIESNEFYSSCPGNGGRGIVATGIRGGTIQWNRSQWQRTFIEIGSTTNQPTEFTNVSNNVYRGTFWGIPTKYTNSGASVSYSGTGMTDTNASFAGLCDAGGASPCAAAAGSFIRVLTAKVTGTTGTFNTAGGYLTDAGQSFTGASVIRGDIVRTTALCLGNGSLPQTKRFSCTGGAGSSGWGDSCVCTANADCGSGICEPRWATVDTVGDLHNLQVDEWDRETACPLGAALCATSSRRPSGAPLSTAGIAYTIYGWTMCQIASYTATSITCTADNWITWGGSAATPSNTTLYEIMWPRPLYFLLAGSLNSVTMTQGIRAQGNTVVGGFSDHFELFTSQSSVIGNYSRDCGDTCIVVEGNKNTVAGNQADHCGARGFMLLGDDSTMTANVAFDSPWIRTSNTTVSADFNVLGNRNTLAANKAIGALPTNLNRYGYVSFGNATGNTDQTIFDTNTCAGTYTVGCYRFDATGGTTTNNHLINYHGETISNNGGTYSIEGGLATFAQMTAATPTNGSYLGCSDCTVNCGAGASNGQSCSRVSAGWTH